jgi:hypothetical protein
MKAREQKVVFFYVLRRKQPLLGPKIAINSVLVAPHQQEGRGDNPSLLNVLSRCGYRLLLPAIQLETGH